MSFFNDAILSKRGPLSKVWLASHLERKLSKAALLQTDIPDSVTAILGPETVPVMALRLSGQLLLGVARIYSRKAKYLMDDCSEALVRIKVAFRSGAITASIVTGADGARAGRGDVDMPEDQVDGGRGNININLNIGQDRGVADFDMLFNAEFGGFGIWNDFGLNAGSTPSAANKKTKSNTVSRQADITLREDHSMYGDEEDPADLYNHGSEDGGIGSQEFRAMSVEGEELDLGLDLDLDLELDLGLMDDDAATNREESPAVVAAQRASRAGTSRVANIAAQARERSSSEAPSIELGRDAPARRGHRDSIASEMLPEAAEGLDKSILDGAGEGTFDSNGMDGEQGFIPPHDDMEMGFAGDDLDLGLDDGQRTPRAGSPVPSVARAPSEPHGQAEQADAEPVVEDGQSRAGSAAPDVDMTPRTANKIAEAAALSSAAKKRVAKPKAAKVHKQIVDAETELVSRPRAAAAAESQSQSQNALGAAGAGPASREERIAQGLLKQPSYLPSSALELRFQEIQRNPNAHFFPGMAAFAENKENQTFYAGPPGLPKELQGLFRFTLGKRGAVLGAKRAHQPDQAQGADEQARKRARSATAAASEVDDVELGRERQPSIPAFEANDMLDYDAGPHDFAAGEDSTNDFQLDLDQGPAVDIANASRAVMEKTPSRMGSIGPLDASLNLDLEAIDRARDSVLAVFDSASKASQSQATTSTPTKRKRDGLLSAPGTRMSEITMAEEEQEETQASTSNAAEGRGRTGGWSRNTVKAMKILEHELGPAEEAEAAEQPKELSFGKLAEKASRKAAASMFFEMLILGTRDCIKLDQKEAYGDIAVQAKPKLWEVCDGLSKLNMEERNVNGDDREATPVASARSNRTERSSARSARA